MAWAGWPGSNGSTMAANGGADVACAEGGLDGDVVAVLPLLLEDEELLLTPRRQADQGGERRRPRHICPIHAILRDPAYAGDDRSGPPPR